MPRPPKLEAWTDFVAWCQKRGLDAVPAHPWTLATYVRWCEPHHAPKAIAKLIKEISAVHESKTRKRLDRDPLVQRTLKMIEARRGTPKPKQRLDLFDEEPAKTPARKPAAGKAKTPKTAKKTTKTTMKSRTKAGLSATPKLVSRRRLSR